jgi:hypothetical protein
LQLCGDGARALRELSERSRVFVTIVAKKNVGRSVCALGGVVKKDIY